MILKDLLEKKRDAKKHDVIRLRWQIADLKAAVERAKRERKKAE